MRFLLVRLSSMGDVVCGLPAASAIKATFPESEITWVVDRRFRALPERCKAIDHVISEKDWDAEEQDEFDWALDLQGLIKSARIASSAKAKQKAGYHWQRELSQLLIPAVKPDPTSIHVVDQYVDVARFAGAQAHYADFQLAATDEDLEGVDAKLAEQGCDPARKLLAVNAGAGWATKRWPPAKFAEALDQLEEVDVAFLGGPDGAEALAEIRAAGFAGGMDLIGQTSIGELVALAERADAHLGGDTGSSHIAAAVGTPCVGLYTMTRPERSCPYGQIHRSRATDVDGVMQNLREALAA